MTSLGVSQGEIQEIQRWLHLRSILQIRVALVAVWGLMASVCGCPGYKKHFCNGNINISLHFTQDRQLSLILIS